MIRSYYFRAKQNDDSSSLYWNPRNGSKIDVSAFLTENLGILHGQTGSAGFLAENELTTFFLLQNVRTNISD